MVTEDELAAIREVYGAGPITDRGHRRTVADLLAEVDRLRNLLTDAITDISDWGAYAGTYFQDKWDLQGTLRQYRDALDGKRSDEPDEEAAIRDIAVVITDYLDPVREKKHNGEYDEFDWGQAEQIYQTVIKPLLAEVWQEGYASGHSRAMRKMSDEPDVAPGTNPYAVEVCTCDADSFPLRRSRDCGIAAHRAEARAQ